MDFRDMDRMGSSDEAIVDEPYRPFYGMILHKPVLVKQLANPNCRHVSQTDMQQRQ
jgi:hypothetical protein